MKYCVAFAFDLYSLSHAAVAQQEFPVEIAFSYAILLLAWLAAL
jgi:hypothetical protein